MKLALKFLLPAALLATNSAYAFTYNEPLIINEWLQIRDPADTSKEWRISYLSGERLGLRSEAASEAELALFIDNSIFTGPVGMVTAYRHSSNLYTQIGFKNEQDLWVFRVTTNLTTSPQVFKSEFYANNYTVGGFYGDLFGVGTESPSARIHGRNDFKETTSTASAYTGIFGVAATHGTSTGNLTLSDTTGGGLKNRFTVFLNGSGTVTQASAVSAGIDVNNGAITDGSSFHAEPLYIASGKSIGTYSGVWVRGAAIDGSLTTHYGVRVDPLLAGTNRYGLYITSDPTFLGGNLTVNGEVSGTGITTTSAANKLVKTNGNGKIDGDLLDIPANLLTTTGNGSGLTALNASNLTSGTVAAARMPAFTGDATSSVGATSLTIANNAVSNLKAADMPAYTIKGNNTGGTADPTDLTVSQVKTLLVITQSDVAGLTTASSPVFAGVTADSYAGAGIATTSTANKLVKTNGSGKIDASFLPTAITATTITLTAPAGDIAMGIYGNP